MLVHNNIILLSFKSLKLLVIYLLLIEIQQNYQIYFVKKPRLLKMTKCIEILVIIIHIPF